MKLWRSNVAVYSNLQIRQALDEGHIVCHPFNPKHISHASLDVTLGYHYYRIERMNERTIYNPFDREDVERYFDGPYKAMPHGEWCKLNGFKPVNNIPLDHPGYINRLTLEIYNLNERETVLLPVGERIAQAVFLETGEVEGSYGKGRDDGFSGKYQQGNDMETIIKTWSPDMMLPRAYKDVRELPAKIEGLFYE
jgi:deoxycytidine triphosphate deaminase